MTVASVQQSRYRDALAVGEFRAIFGSFVISMLGTVVAELALTVLAFVLGLIAPVFASTRAATIADALPEAAYAPGRSLLRVFTQGAQIGGFAIGGARCSRSSPRAARCC